MTSTQTILHDDPHRPGNCFAACVATALDKPLSHVPHFVEWGQWLHNERLKDADDPDRKHWWAMFLGYCAGVGVWPESVPSPDAAATGELVFVAGKSPRGVMHQVLYRDGVLWHDPHPSSAGVTDIDLGECFVLRPLPTSGHDHTPTHREADS